jgi:hypothetical protein
MKSHTPHENILEGAVAADKLMLLKNHRRSPSMLSDDFGIAQLAEPPHIDSSGSRLSEESEASKQGGFAGSRLPQKCCDLPGMESNG